MDGWMDGRMNEFLNLFFTEMNVPNLIFLLVGGCLKRFVKRNNQES